MSSSDWTILIHGGAGVITRETLDPAAEAGARAGLGAAVDAGAAILAAGGSAIDAVEAAVRLLEDDPHFNAGRGAALSLGGKPVARIEGGAARLVTDKAGKPTALVGVEQKPQTVTLRLPGQAARRVKLAGNECVTLA